MRAFYTTLLYLLTPAVLARLAWRGLRAPAYLARWGERFGFFPEPADASIWVHAVSFGEVQAALPLVRVLRRMAPDLPIVVTTTTPTGSARVREALGDEVMHGYVPYDLPGAVRRFLKQVRPRLAVVMETELWPNLFAACRARGIPLVVANARLSPRSLGGYRRFARLVRETLADVDLIAAQTEEDAERFRALGAPAERVMVMGSIKYDLTLPPGVDRAAKALRAEWGADRPVLVAGSTHEGEDERVLDAFVRVRRALGDCLLVLVPRHPERFSRVATLVRRRGWRLARRSQGERCRPQTAVYLGDTMGELPLLYAAGDVAFVGGSLIAHGGHNPIEPAALGRPVVFGPHTFNFEEISAALEQAGAARRVDDPDGLATVALAWLVDPDERERVGRRGREVVARSRGALETLVKALMRWLPARRRAAVNGRN